MIAHAALVLKRCIYTPICKRVDLWIFENLADMLAIMRMDPIILEVKGQVTIDMYGKKLVYTIEIKPLCASSSNLADILIMMR